MMSDDIETLAELITSKLIERGYLIGNQYEMFPEVSEVVSDVITEYVGNVF